MTFLVFDRTCLNTRYNLSRLKRWIIFETTQRKPFSEYEKSSQTPRCRPFTAAWYRSMSYALVCEKGIR
ncbi:MAG: hypothetical protein CSA33_04525 [Desulfobulbus propionicus]|nr:MAG: hypothetical protein CSA33_04525 [Desulfobulbus propionicus]